ncbi:seminal plasma protein HSP-1-like [Arapaima gigas]
MSHRLFWCILCLCPVRISTEMDISADYCVFPFQYKGLLYHSCTGVNSANGRLWCSLTSNYDQDRLWGYCLGKECECGPHLIAVKGVSESSRRSLCYSPWSRDIFLFVMLLCLAEPSCVFPFIYGNKRYYSCTTAYWFPGLPWCSSTANYDKDKKWVYCSSSGTVLSLSYSVLR